MEGEVLKIRVKGIAINDLLSEKLSKSLNESKSGLKTIALVIVSEEEKEGKKEVNSITLNHTTPKDFEEKLLQIDSSNPKLLEEIKKILDVCSIR